MTSADGIASPRRKISPRFDKRGYGLCLQLKAGNSHLTKRATDGVEVFATKKPRWVKTWTQNRS